MTPVEEFEKKPHKIESWKLAVMDTYISVLLEHFMENSGNMNGPIPDYMDEIDDDLE